MTADKGRQSDINEKNVLVTAGVTLRENSKQGGTAYGVSPNTDSPLNSAKEPIADKTFNNVTLSAFRATKEAMT